MKSVSDSFEIDHVELILGLTSIDASLGETLLAMAAEKLTLDARECHITAAEIWAGVCRAYTLANISDTRTLQTIVEKALDICAPDMVKDWVTALRFIATEVDCRRLQWLSNVLLELALPSNSTADSANDSPSQTFKRLCFLEAFCVEFAWRGVGLRRAIASRLAASPHLMKSPFNQIRQEIARLLFLVLRSEFRVRRDAEEGVSYDALPRTDGIDTLLDTMMTQLQTAADLNWVQEDVIAKETTTLLESCLSLIIFCVQMGEATYSGDVLLKCLSVICSSCHHPNAETAAIAKHALTGVAWAEFHNTQRIGQLVEVVNTLSISSSWKVRLSVLEFLQTTMIRHSFLLSVPQIRSVSLAQCCFRFVLANGNGDWMLVSGSQTRGEALTRLAS